MSAPNGRVWQVDVREIKRIAEAKNPTRGHVNYLLGLIDDHESERVRIESLLDIASGQEFFGETIEQGIERLDLEIRGLHQRAVRAAVGDGFDQRGVMDDGEF